MSQLIIVLGDQLSFELSALKRYRAGNDRILMCEIAELAKNVGHHKKKLAFVFSAMRHFAKELIDQNHALDYVKFDDPSNTHSLLSEIQRQLDSQSYESITLTSPKDYHLLQAIQTWHEALPIPINVLKDDSFYCDIDDFRTWANGKKSLRMEFFYRKMRQEFNILLTKEGKPEGGAWNFDAQNRKRLPDTLTPPPPFQITADQITKDTLAMVSKHFDTNFGYLDDFHYAVTRKQAQAALEDFIHHRLPQFGDYQDAMRANDPWLFHSHLSLYINCGLLSPRECVSTAIDAYQQEKIGLNSVEGFIRQIIGWREFIRGIYWLYMPDYEDLNFFEASKPLPHFYWDANTKMNCLHHCVKDTREHAYAHHIQRLMVLGNFATLAGLSPRQVNEWFLIVYADAYSWVELPNVSGMALFADGGKFASKPYIASGKYINKMSDYCKSCHYNVNQREESGACPFNALYWHFLLKHRSKLESNPRMRLVYKQLDKFSQETRAAIIQRAQSYLQTLYDDRP